METIVLDINGRQYEMLADKSWTLLRALRDGAGLTGTKCGCGTGDCGTCTVIIDGVAEKSCLIQALKAQHRKIETIEGLRGDDGGFHPIQQAFVECGAIQCGFCTPGVIMRVKALLDSNPEPTEQEILEALDAHLCRCTGYYKIIQAVKTAAERMREAEQL